MWALELLSKTLMLGPFQRALALLSVEVLLLVPSCLSTPVNQAAKSTEQYWMETGLGSAELETLISDESCRSETKVFLACLNAINQMAEKYNLVLSDSGSLVPITSSNVDSVATEKLSLKRWERRDFNSVSALSLWKLIDQNHIRPFERSAVIASGINGFLSVYKDPHTYILPLSQYEEVISKSEAKQDKVGFVFRKIGHRVIIKKVFEGSPSDRAGLKKGDEILEISGKKTNVLLGHQISDLLKVRPGQRIALAILRGTEKKYLEIIKSDTLYSSVNSQILGQEKKIGLISLHRFAKDTCEQTKMQLIGLMEQGIRGLLIDVRDNPGGQLDEAACIANLFVPKGSLLFETRYLDPLKSGENYTAQNEQVYSGPVAVLINSGSASASEILAGSLKDLGRASLVGERSFGKGSFQDGHLWSPNSKIALFQTEGLYYFPSGWTPQLVGLEPDLPVLFSLRDNQRESEVFYNPIKPKDTWTGPQTLAWLNKITCDPLNDFQDEVDSRAVDNQVQEARSWILCKSQLSKARAEVNQ